MWSRLFVGTQNLHLEQEEFLTYKSEGFTFESCSEKCSLLKKIPKTFKSNVCGFFVCLVFFFYEIDENQ